jgi:periplasmic protein CpxP/Spy
MKASLCARAAPVLLLAATLGGGVGTTAFAQTAPAPATPPAASTAPPDASAAPPAASVTPSAAPSGSATTAAPGTRTATHHMATTHTHKAASRAPGETMEQMAERRVADLHTRLHITAAEQTQWDQFAQMMLDNAKDLDQAYQQRAAGFDKLNAVENMQSYAQIEQTRAQDLQKLVPAFQALYASLSDQQKQDADQLFRNQAAHAAQRHAAAKH